MTKPQTETTPAPASGNIHQRLIAIMRELEAIPKDRKNTQQNYNFRGIDDIYNFAQPVFAKHGVFMSSTIISERTEERTSRSGSALIYRVFNQRWRFMAEDGTFVETDVIAEGMDSGDKAANKAMSVGQKYAIIQVLMIPTADAKDPENDSPEVAPKPKASPANTVSTDADTFLDGEPEPEPWAHLADIKKAKDALHKLTGDDGAYYCVLYASKANHADEIPVADRPATIAALRKAYAAESAKIKAGKK